MPGGRRNAGPALSPEHYFLRSQQPLQALIFLLPLIVLYELGALFYATPVTGRRLSARSYMQDFLELFGAVGDYLPGLAVVVVLLAWHVAQRDRWRFQPWLYPGMLLESAALAVPLLVFGVLTGPQRAAAVLAAPPPLAGSVDLGSMPWQAALVFSIGAGIYEELVFRLAAIALVHLLLVDVLEIPERRGAVLAVLASALLFAGYHFTEDNPFTWPRFVFYFAAGLYFAVIYVLRGFGIVAAAHAFYDIMIVALAQGILSWRG